MSERIWREILDEITDFLLNSEEIDAMLAFCEECIRRALNLDRVTISREKGISGLLSLPISHRGEIWGHLALYGDRPPLAPEESEFVRRAIGLTRLALQKTETRRENRGADLVDRVPVAIIQTDRAGNCLYVNPFWCQLTDCPVERARGNGWLDSIHADDRARVAKSWQISVQEGSSFYSEFRIRRPDRSIRWIYARIVPDRDGSGEIAGYVGKLTDMTHYRQIDRVLREKQQQLATITANVPVGVYRAIYHADGQFSLPYASAGFEELIGVSPRVLTDSPESALSAIHPEDRQKVRSELEKVKNGQWSHNFHDYIEYRLIDRSGQVRWVRDYATFSRSRTGDLILDGAIVDISEQKRAKEEIAFQASILDQVRNAVIATDLDGSIVYWNRHARELYLLEEEEKGKSILSTVVSPGDRQMAREVFESSKNTGTWSGKFPVRRRDGTTFIAQVVNTLIEDENGRPRAVVGVSSDISDRERLENAIGLIARGVSSATGEAFFQSLVEYLATVLGIDYAMIGRLIPNTRTVTTIALYGKGQRQANLTYDIAGTPCEKVIDGEANYYPDRVAETFPEDKMLVEMGIESFLGKRLIDSRGEAIGLIAVFSGHSIPENDISGEILQIFAVRATAELERQAVLDSLREINENLEDRVRKRTGDLIRAIDRLSEEIEERVQVEAALRKSEERYRNLVTTLPYGVQECDVTGLLTYSNPANDRLFGLEPGTLVGSRIWDRLAREEDRRHIQEYLQFLNREQPPPTPYRSLFKKAKGETIDVQIDWTYLRDDSGRLTGYLSIISDITERQRAEREIQRALEKERQLNQLKTEFIDIASHEFRTPLTVVLGSIQFLLKRYHQLSDERRFEHFHRVREAGIQLRELIEEMWTVSRADSGRITLDPVDIDLDRLARELIEEIRVASSSERCFNLQIDNLPGTVSLDRKLLHHILTNLLFNAIKYSPRNSPVDLAIEGRGDRVIFTVIDRGIGIPPEDGERVFESFHRGRNVGDIPGTGLGLKIAKMYVEAMNGTISFTSQLGIGSTFVVNLPL